MADLQERLLRFIRARALFARGDRVLVALSGGVDSVVLLHLLHASAEELGITLCAAHFDHAMGSGSEADAEWVAGLCTSWQIEFVGERSNRPLYGETDARTERYRFLQTAQQRLRCNRVATAHHADDQIETVIFRLLRGTGMRGLAGIPLRRGALVRPLLPFSKRAILDYATSHDLAYRDDPTNAEIHFLRNRIRNSVVPVLQSVEPNAGRSVLRLARLAARNEAAWNSLLKDVEREVVQRSEKSAIELARPVLLEYHPELRARVLRHYLRGFGVVPSRAATRDLLQFCERAPSGAVLEFGGRIRVERNFDALRIARASERNAERTSVIIAGERGRAELRLATRTLVVEWRVDDVLHDHAEHFAVALLGETLELRGWRAGDRIRLAYGTKKLKKLFAERRVPASERADIPVLVNESGDVLWVPSVARSVIASPPDKGPVLNIMVSHAEPS